MSKKVGGTSTSASTAPEELVEDGSPPGTAVDFIFRTMIQRASAPGKRQIRPKNVEELLTADIQELGSDEDPDFDVSKDKHHNESDLSIDDSSDSDQEEKGSMDGNADSDDEDDHSYDASRDMRHLSSGSGSDSGDSGGSGGSDESDSDSDVSGPGKKSALRDTLQKLNEAESSIPLKKKKRKKPKKVVGVGVSGSTSASASAGATGKKPPNKKSDTSSSKPKTKTPISKTKQLKSGKSRTNPDTSRSKSKSGTKSTSTGGRKGDRDRDRTRNREKRRSKSISDRIFLLEKNQKENRKEMTVIGSPICSACLGKASDELNEIVECDSCGITVHEGCYGISDTLSVSSAGSSCSTEPWFCDACKTGVKFISCELCPMKGGLFKETSVGRWVHLVCARYTPGVSINESGLPNLLDLAYSRWGAHPCSVCEDIHFIRSGICIPCDAGMCKTFLHATCAQKYGLLSDPISHNSTISELEADPFYAACKLHTNRETSKRRSKMYAVLQEQLRVKKEKKLNENLTPTERHNQDRIQRKLERIRFKVAIKQAHSYSQHQHKSSSSSGPGPLSPLSGGGGNLNLNLNLNFSSNLNSLPSDVHIHTLPQSWKEGQKRSRFLSTSAGTAISFLRKAELMGLDIKSYELEDKHTKIVSSVKKKWNVLPGPGVEFAAYYSDRETRIKNLMIQCEKLEKENQRLNHHQEGLQGSFDQHYVHNELMDEDTDRMRGEFVGLSKLLRQLAPPKKLLSELTGLLAKVDGVRRRRSPSQGKRVSPSKCGILKKLKKGSNSRNLHASSERLSIKVCSVCNKSDEQPWIIRCDHCHKLYHLKCLDPPLTRIPKRSRLCGWMCSDCGEEEIDAEESEVDPEAPRTLRGRTKIRKPGKYRLSTDSREDRAKIDALQLSESKVVLQQIPEQMNTEAKSANEVKKEKSSTTSTVNGNKKPSKKRSTENVKAAQNPQPHNINITSGGETPQSQPQKKIRTTPAKKRNSGSGTPTEKKPKVIRKRKDKSSVLSVSNADLDGIASQLISGGDDNKLSTTPTAAATAQDQNPTINIKSESSKKKITSSGKKSKVKGESPGGGEGFPSLPLPLIPKKKRSRSTPVKKEKLESSTSTPVPVPGQTRKVSPKKESQNLKLNQSENESTDSLNLTNNPPSTIVLKKQRKLSKPKTKKSTTDKQKESIIMGSMMAAAAEVKKNEEAALIVNGNPIIKATPVSAKKRKSSVTKSKSLTSGSGGKEAGVGVGAPAKKRRKITPKPKPAIPSSPLEFTNQAAVIDSVAVGKFENKSLDEMNGLLLGQPTGVLMQGVATAKSNSDWGDDSNSIMKGHAMGSISTNEEIVTMKTSDLIDYVINSRCSASATGSGPGSGQNSASGGSGYTPGFYSTANSTNDPTSTFSGSGSGGADALRSSGSGSGSVSETMTTGWDHGHSHDRPTAPDSQQNQNVIQLHYEAPESSTSTTTFASTTGATQSATTNSFPPTSTATAKPNWYRAQLAAIRCFVCRNEDLQRNLVTCDRCAQDFHFMCLRPPLKYSPRRRGYSWYCFFCDDSQTAAKHKDKEAPQNKQATGTAASTTPVPTPLENVNVSPLPTAVTDQVSLPGDSPKIPQQTNYTVRLYDDRINIKGLINALNQ